METATIADVTQQEFDDAVQMVISGLKSSDRRLDTRLGTALRSLLVEPEARIEATIRKQLDFARDASSLKTLKEAEDAGRKIDPDDVNAVMSNFNLRSSTGTKAEGIVKMSVDDGTKTYAVPAGTEFRTIDGLRFVSTEQVTASDGGAGAKLYKGSANYFFLVPVIAENVGDEYNIRQGTSLSTSASLYTFIGAEAYKSFDGGSNVDDLDETISKIPSGLSIRGFVNKSACEGMLRDRFDSGRFPIVACSAVGYGNGAQRRDKHNVFGVGVGGRIDLYVRNFGDLFTITKTVPGSKRVVMDDGGYSVERVDYSIDVTPDDFPGCYWVKNVSCIDVMPPVGDTERDVNSPLEFSCKRVAVGTKDTWHDFDVSKNPSEAFNSVWHGISLTAEEVPPALDDEGEEYWPDERMFSVSAYCLPQARELQEYVDGDMVRSVSTDVVVRCPIICTLEISANIVYDVDNPVDVEYAKTRIRRYVNGLGFVKAITRSEIVHILKECGAISVNLDKKDMLYGTLYDANGKEYKLSGDSIVLDGLADDSAMLTKDTTVFAVEPESIQITLTPNK